jgi:integrase
LRADPFVSVALMARRAYGSGSLQVKRLKSGGEVWLGRWYDASGARIKRHIGPKRTRGRSVGLTRAQAERELRKLIDSEVPTRRAERMSVGEAGRRYVESREALGRAPTTIQDYAATVRNHFDPFFGATSIDRISSVDIEGYMAHKRRQGRALKSVSIDLALLSSIFTHAIRRGWRTRPDNPVSGVERPKLPRRKGKLKFFDEAEFEALLRACLDTDIGRQDRVMYIVAGLAGFRQAELLGLRWYSVDWSAMKLRAARDTFTRGHMKESGKSEAAGRGVPMAVRVGRELELHSQRSRFTEPHDLVFPNPLSGEPQQRSEVHRRLKRTLKRAGVREELTLHGLRHTFGTRLAAAGVPLVKIQEWLGHENAETTQIYVDYQPSEQDGRLVERAFGADPFGLDEGPIQGPNLHGTESNSGHQEPRGNGKKEVSATPSH